ncbi:MAG: glutamate racemase [Flavobacteriales bacterium]|nr:glutamate racemase [Flavobacteriales bacterium]
MATHRIGIFDSGIGGLTVASAIRKTLPSESFVYFGDTAHLPYGDKSAELIQGYALRITEFLLHEMHCKAIVIACNTASAAAYEVLRDRYKGSVPVINVIDPMVERIIADDNIHHVGIIATKTTVNSGVYQEKLSRRKPSLKYAAVATPLLATMIEEGFYNSNVSHAVLEKYLNDKRLKSIDALVLACTHYPLIKKEIASFLGPQVQVLDSAEVVADKLRRILEKEGLTATSKEAEDIFYVSDFTESFAQSTSVFFPEKVELRKSNLWESKR